jgi:hypothetical protein
MPNKKIKTYPDEYQELLNPEMSAALNQARSKGLVYIGLDDLDSTKEILNKVNNPIRYPPEDYIFNCTNFDSNLNDDDFVEFGKAMRFYYNELSNWPNCNLFTAWMNYGEAIYYLADPSTPAKRDDDFPAFLFAEQELGEKGLFTHYDLDKLDDLWSKTDLVFQPVSGWISDRY